MNKLIVALVAGTFVTAAAAQTAAPKLTTEERRAAVRSTTQTGSEGYESTSVMYQRERAANVKASKEVEKLSRAEKKALAKEANASVKNPDNPSGTQGTAAMQRTTTAESKAVPKNRPNLNTPEARMALEDASTR